LAEKKEESYLERRLKEILDTKGDIVLKEVRIEIDKLELSD